VSSVPGKNHAWIILGEVDQLVEHSKNRIEGQDIKKH
jgi:hypothetical protein